MFCREASCQETSFFTHHETSFDFPARSGLKVVVKLVYQFLDGRFFSVLVKNSESARVKMSAPLKKSKKVSIKKILFPKFYDAKSLSAKTISLK